MDTAFGDFITSAQFKFLIGPDQIPISVHRAPIAHLSPALGALMNGHMMEANSGTATLADVDLNTFVRFVDYAYTGGVALVYSGRLSMKEGVSAALGNPVHLSSGGGTARVMLGTYEDHPLTYAMMDGMISKHKKPKFDLKRLVSKTPCAKTFRKNSYPAKKHTLFDSHPLMAITLEQYSRSTALTSYSEAPVKLAQLYVFADKYAVSHLRAFVLQSLYRILQRYARFNDEDTRSIVHVMSILKLVRFVFDDDNTAGRQVTSDPLRALVVDYVFTRIDSFKQDKSFVELLDENGTFCSDLLRRHMGVEEPEKDESESEIGADWSGESSTESTVPGSTLMIEGGEGVDGDIDEDVDQDLGADNDEDMDGDGLEDMSEDMDDDNPDSE